MIKRTLFVSALATVFSINLSSSAEAIELINNSSQGYYNANLGDLFTLDPNFFLGPDGSTGDPFINFPTAPDLTSVEALGDWLSNPTAALANGSWSGLQTIPSEWLVNTETAIIYEIDGGVNGLSNVVGNFGVDNSIFVWVNGVYKLGVTAPGGTLPGEYQINFGTLNPGSNFIQVLRADHGLAATYDVSITGDIIDPRDVPEPSSILAFLTVGVLTAARPLVKRSES